MDGLILPAFCDSHVHLGLIDPAVLAAGGIGRVLDLGWDPSIATTWLDPGVGGIDIDIAGPLLAAPGGYPVGSGWAPSAAVREIANHEDATAAIIELSNLGARVAKVTLNSEAGPVWDDELLDAVVALAHERSLAVVAHAQGAGQAERAFVAGVDCLAHAPWTESLADELIEGMAPTMAWISTLDIHGWGTYGADFTRAVDNLARFAAAGGRVYYGTDLGNGLLPVGLNRRELVALTDAGLGIPALVASLRGFLPPVDRPTVAALVPGAQRADDIHGVDDLLR
ncbi:MAG TPA: hypothetical protein VGM94_13420, partial [Galbitalea sp.]